MKLSKTLAVLVASTAASVTAGCQAFIPVPPMSLPSLVETPETVAPGQAKAAFSGVAAGAILGPNVGALAYTHTLPIGECADLAISPTLHDYGNPAGRIAGYRAGDALGYGINARVKARPFSTEHVAVFGGLGGGMNRFASFVTVTAGASAAYVNRYLVPFVDAQTWGGAPFAVRNVIYAASSSDTPRALRATNTIGVLVSAGLAWPVTDRFELRIAGAYGGVRTETNDSAIVGAAFAAGFRY